MCCVLCAVAVQAALSVPLGHPDFWPSPERPIGFRGDGSGSYPGANPITEWSDELGYGEKRKPGFLGKGVIWRTLMPNFSNSSPIVIGKRVYAMSDPKLGTYAPLLVCLDANTGKILWEREIDHTELLPEKVRAGVQKDWLELRTLAETIANMLAERGPIQAALRNKPDDEALKKRLADWKAKAAELGVDKAKRNGGEAFGYSFQCLSDKQVARQKVLRQKYGCRPIQWGLSVSQRGIQLGAYVGYSWPTPVCDGKHIYVFTGYNAVACFDLDGNRKWLRWLGPTNPSREGGEVDYTQSPVLAAGKVLVGNKWTLTALDAATGKTAWTRKVNTGHVRSGGSVKLGGIAFRLGKEHLFFWRDGVIYRIRDGVPVSGRIVDPYPLLQSSYPMVRDDLLIWVESTAGFRSFSFVQVYQLEWVGDRVLKRALWRKQTKERPVSGFLLDGRVYLPGRNLGSMENKVFSRDPNEEMYDLRSGAVLGRAAFLVDHAAGAVRAGEYIITAESIRSAGTPEHCRFSVHSLDGKLVRENVLSAAAKDAARLKRIRSMTGRSGWSEWKAGMFHAAPFFVRDRMYVRSYDEVICVGDVKRPPLTDPAVGKRKALDVAKPAGPKSTVAELIPKLQSKNAIVAGDAVDALAATGVDNGKAVTKAMIALLKHKPYAAVRAADWLGESKDCDVATAVPALLGMVGDSRFEVAKAAADALFKSKVARGQLIATLGKLAVGAKEETAARSMLILTECGLRVEGKDLDATVKVLVNAMQRAPQNHTKGQAAYALGVLGKRAKPAIPALKEAALRPDCKTQARAAIRKIDPSINVNKIQPSTGGGEDEDDLGLDL